VDHVKEYEWMEKETTVLIEIEKQREGGFFSHARVAVKTLTDPEKISLFIDEYINLIYRRMKKIGSFYNVDDPRHSWGFRMVALSNIWFWVGRNTPTKWIDILTEKGVEKV
jgi:hypothetical protein